MEGFLSWKSLWIDILKCVKLVKLYAERHVIQLYSRRENSEQFN